MSHNAYVECREYTYVYENTNWHATGIRCTQGDCDWSASDDSELSLIDQWRIHALENMERGS